MKGQRTCLSKRIGRSLVGMVRTFGIAQIWSQPMTCWLRTLLDHHRFGPQEPGREGYKHVVTLFHRAFSNLRVTNDDIIAEGDRVTLRWTGRGTHSAELAGIPPTGKHVTITGI